jgi:hypothetical protein
MNELMETVMSFSEDENYLTWECEQCDASMEFERVNQPGYFMSCVNELKDRGWRIGRDRYGDWTHTCPKCRRAEAGKVAEILAMPSNKVRR